MSNKHAKAGDKLEQWWGSIAKEKLDTLRWVLLHSGINVARLQNDDGLTGLQVAAKGDRAKAILVMLDVMRQKRELGDAIDVADDEGRTPLMLAAAAGAAKSVEHLLYYGASQTVKSDEGLTAREYAVKARKTAVVEVFDEHNDTGKPEVDGGGEVEAVDADGLTSTQRSRQKKKQMQENERKGTLAAVAAAMAAVSLEGDGNTGAPERSAASPHGVPPLPALPPAGAVWPEVAAALGDRRRELCIDRVTTGDDRDAVSALVVEGGIDGALWHCTLLNRLELRLPPPIALPPLVGHLTHLSTLIVCGLGLTSLPEALAACAELRFMDCSRNALTALPAALGRLPRLEVLNFADNHVADVGPLSTSTSLVTLTADRNEIEDVAALNFGGLARLETLSLSGNRLRVLPDEIGALQQLAVLNVADNVIEELPSRLSELKEKKIRELRLLPNPIADKKVLKILASDRSEKVVKELFKHLASSAAAVDGKGKGGGAGKRK